MKKEVSDKDASFEETKVTETRATETKTTTPLSQERVTGPSSVPSAEVKELTDKEKILNKLNDILKEHGGESNVPTNSEYWQLLNQFRSLP